MKIGIIPGDGIGPEVMSEGLKVLNLISKIFGFQYHSQTYPFGANHYLATKELFPESAQNELKQMDAVLFGAVGDPRVERGKLERAIILGLRFGFDLYINLRPIKLYSEHICPLKNKMPEDINIMVIRENTEGAYAQVGGFFRQKTSDEISIQTMINTKKGVSRAIEYAFDLCRKRNKKKKLTLIDKSNAMPAEELWTNTFEEIGKNYPDIQKEHLYVDAACMLLVKNPESFDTIVTTNLFGDIITDLGAELVGGIGIAASANIHPGKVSMFEPIHGSAPNIQGKNIANPFAMILAVQMMLDYLKLEKPAQVIEQAVINIIRSKTVPVLSIDSGFTTNQLGDLVCKEIQKISGKLL